MNPGTTDDASIQDAFQLPEQLAVPLKLATVGIERNPYGVYLDREADELDQRLAKDRVTFRDVVPLVDFLFSGRERGTLDLDRIHRVAARAHAEALLINAVVRDSRSARETAPTGTADDCAKDAKRRLRQESFDAPATSLRDKIDRNVALRETPTTPAARGGLRYRTAPPE